MTDDADLAARIADARRFADDETLPPSIRARWRQALGALERLAFDPESRDDFIEDRDRLFPKYVRDPDLIPRLVASGAVIADDDAATIAVRWDLIAPADRPATVSYLNELADGYRGRPVGGRPRK